MDIRGLQLHFKKEKPSVLYIIQGEDYFLKTEAETTIKNHFKEEGQEFDLEVFYGDQMNYEKCVDSFQTLSFFSSRKVIHIKNAEKLKSEFLDTLLEVVASGTNTEGLVVILSFLNLDKRKKVVKNLVEASTFIEVKTPYEDQVVNWISYISQKEGVKIEREAQSLIQFLVGPSLTEISKSIVNLKEVFPGEEITKDKVQSLISKNGEEDIFKICDLLGDGKITEALLGLENILKTSSSGIGALNLFYRHFKILEGILLEVLKNNKSSVYLSKKDLAAKVGVPSFFLEKYRKQTKNWNLKKLKQVFFALEAADLSLKSTKLKERTVFSALFVEISKTLTGSNSKGNFSEAVLS